MSETKKETQSLISAAKEFLSSYEGLKKFDGLFAEVLIDQSGENPTSYTIESVPTDTPIVKKYTDGSSVRQLIFAISSKEVFGNLDNVDTSAFYEELSDWMEEKNLRKEFPMVSAKKEIQSIRATTNGYLYNQEGTQAIYRIQCVMKYYQKA